MTTSFQRAFADYLREIARWRRQRADELDRDARNLQSAAGLDELADYVLALPEDDPRLQTLDRLAFADDAFTPGQQTHYTAGRFRFHYPDVSCDGFLTHLAELAVADSREQGNFAGRTPEGDNPWAPRSFADGDDAANAPKGA